MIKRLKIKLIAINMVLITIVLFSTFGAVYASTSHQIVNETNRSMQKMLDNKEDKAPPKIEIGGYTVKYGNEANTPPTNIPIFSVQLDAYNNLIKVFENNVTVVDEAALNDMIATSLKSNRTVGILYDQNFRYQIVKNELGTKIAFADRTDEINRLTSLVKTSALVGIGSLIGFFLISLFLARWAVKPIATSLEQQSQFVADASHELKTPLTVILANADILLTNKEKTIAEQQKWIEYIQTEAKRMTSLVTNLLFLAKIDDRKNDVILNEVNLSDIVWSSMLPFESVAFEQGKMIESKIENDLHTHGDEGKLKQLIVILIDNAIKYANHKGTITVSLIQDQEKVKLSVNNTGEPIPAGQLGHIFKRFYRVDKSRVREKGGYGLGLAIAESIVTAHRGKISVTSTEKEGTTFTVIFLKNKQSKQIDPTF